MNAPVLTRTRTREQEIELALKAMKWALLNKEIPQPVRYRVAKAHTALTRRLADEAKKSGASAPGGSL